MANYTLTVYKTKQADDTSASRQQMWIQLLDWANQQSHIFSFVSGDRYGHLGGCGILQRLQYLPERIEETMNISVSRTTYQEMIEEGDALHNQYLIYDDGEEHPVECFQ